MADGFAEGDAVIHAVCTGQCIVYPIDRADAGFDCIDGHRKCRGCTAYITCGILSLGRKSMGTKT